MQNSSPRKIDKNIKIFITSYHGKTVEQAFTLDINIRLFFKTVFNIRMKL
jgi:hypothetical protein